MADEHVSFETAADNPADSPNSTPLPQPEPAQQTQPDSECAIGLLNSHGPRDLLAKSQEVLTFLTASFANEWPCGMSQEEINGVYWVLDSAYGALGCARKNMGYEK